MVEHALRKCMVVGSIPTGGSCFFPTFRVQLGWGGALHFLPLLQRFSCIALMSAPFRSLFQLLAAHKVTPAGLEPAIPGSVGRCLIHWATGPVATRATLFANSVLPWQTLMFLLRYLLLHMAPPSMTKCISRESNPGHIDGNDVFYQTTTCPMMLALLK